MEAHRSDAHVVGAGQHQRRLALVNRGADKWAAEGAQVGTNEVLAFVSQACTEAVSQARFALALQAELAARVFAEHSE